MDYIFNLKFVFLLSLFFAFFDRRGSTKARRKAGNKVGRLGLEIPKAPGQFNLATNQIK
jgi:hypothetical protein